MTWYRVKLTRHIEEAVLAQAKQRGMDPNKLCEELVEIGLVSLNTFARPLTPSAEYATMQPEENTYDEVE